VLAQRNFLHSRPRPADGFPDLEWWHPEGRAPTGADWDGDLKAMGALVRASAETLRNFGAREVFVFYNAGPARDLVMPAGDWVQLLDSANPDAPDKPAKKTMKVAEQSVMLFAHPEKEES